MALIFPSNPTLNQIFSTGSLSWIWNGKSWNNGTSILVTSNLVSGSAQFTNGNSAAFDTTSNVTFGQVTASFAKITGSIFGTASFSEQAFSASYALSASYVLNAVSASYSLTSSFSIQSQTASFVTTAQTASYVLLAQTASYISTASYALAALSASYAPNIYVLPNNVVSSSAQLSNGGGVAFDTNSNITVNQVTASFAKITNLTVEYVTSSVMVITGSNKFGDASNDKQEFTGSVSISGSLSVNGPITGTSSLASTASYFAGVSNGTTNYVTKFTGANTIGSSSIFDNGSVGIGTSSPSAKLDIGSTASAGALSGLIFSGLNSTSTKADYVKMFANVEFNVAAAEGGGYQLQVLQQGAYKNSIVASGITNNSTNYLALSTTNEAVRIISNGNVGIGTSSPLATLDVNTSGTTNYQNVANFFQPSQPDSQLMSISIGQSAVSGKEALIGFYKGTSAASYSNSYMALNIFGDSWGSGLVLAKGGNVGIGTTSPSYKLSISANNVTGGIFVQDTDAANASPVIRVQGNRVDTNSSQGFSGGLVLERYMSNGSTGIVSGNALGTIYFGGNYNTTPTFTYPASISAIAEANWTSTSAASTGLAFFTGATGQSLGTANVAFGTERMRIDSSGNVGIGTTSIESGFKLHVAGNGFFSGTSGTIAKVVVDNADQRLVLGSYFEGGVGQYSFISSTNNAETGGLDLRFRTGTDERMTIASTTGNVGIGTTSPSTKLDVNGNGRFIQNAAATTGAIILRQAAADAEGSFIQWVNNANTVEKGWFTVDTSSNMKFATVSTERMRIDSSGNVGIGTTTPGYKLEVNGALAFGQFANSKPTNSQLPVIYAAQSLSGFNYGDLIFQGRQEGFDNAHIVFLTGASSTERLRITGSGTVAVTGALGATGSVWSGNNVSDTSSGTTDGVTMSNGAELNVSRASNASVNIRRRTDDGAVVVFRRDTTQVGTISVTTTATAYNTSSDARLKTNIRPLTNSGSIIDSLRPVLHDWKSGVKDTYGFIAQEVYSIFPQAVTKGDDDPETVTQQWAMDASKFMPLAIAELKSLRTRLAALEAK
jgi:hypothetical protein